MKHILNIGYRMGLMMATMLLLNSLQASSHREAPMIANDPLADNTDVYAFRSPDDPNSVTLIANYVPLQLAHGGPNYYHFGENIRYEIHIDNDVTTTGDDIIYRFTFTRTNEDPTTFFNIRLGSENIKNTYTMERSMDGGQTFTTVITNGIVPAYNIGPRSIESPVGLAATDYEDLFNQGITTTADGEKVFCGPTDDPFFVDLGGVFDLGDSPRQSGMPADGVACFNVSTIAVQVPISMLQKDGKDVSMATNILDGDYVIGVWASASRQQIRTLNPDGSESYSGNWVQVSRLGMPLTNEAVIPIGDKDDWNARTPYNENPAHFEYFYNPELGLYMDDALFGGAVPAFSALRIQRNSLGAFDFGNGNDGLFGLKGSPAVAGTALDDAVFGTLLLPAAGKPRSVDLWPAFHTGVPNVVPYQLATGKGGNPLAAGKPFVNNFLPNGGDMLRLNMATPVTDRTDPAFSSNGLITAAVLGLTDPTFASNSNLEFIPNMDGFPNGRRLEDDVTRIELQAVSGVVLAAIGLWYDDFDPSDPNASPVTQDLLDVLTYTTGVESNDAPFRSTFPYVQLPWSGAGKCGGLPVQYEQPEVLPPTQSVGSFTLINAQTDQDLMPLQDGDIIDINVIGTNKLNVRANTFPGVVGSVRFGWDGNPSFRNENNPPYALGGSTKSGSINYFEAPLTLGTHTITATPFSGKAAKGTEGVAFSISFTIVNNAPTPTVNDFTLINAVSDQPVGPLMDGDMIDLSVIGTNKLNIVANTSPVDIGGSVVFDLNGNMSFSTDNNPPYSIPGDNGNGGFFQLVVAPGSYTLTATPFSGSGGQGTAGNAATINFTVINGTSTSKRGPIDVQAEAIVYPNPTKGQFHFSMKNAAMGAVSMQVFNQVGTVVRQLNFFSGADNWKYDLDLSDLPDGMYLVQVIDSQQSITKRLLKQE
ncbi:MAG: DUF4331 family protein [Bacteroidota bacterium]